MLKYNSFSIYLALISLYSTVISNSLIPLYEIKPTNPILKIIVYFILALIAVASIIIARFILFKPKKNITLYNNCMPSSNVITPLPIPLIRFYKPAIPKLSFERKEKILSELLILGEMDLPIPDFYFGRSLVITKTNPLWSDELISYNLALKLVKDEYNKAYDVIYCETELYRIYMIPTHKNNLNALNQFYSFSQGDLLTELYMAFSAFLQF